MPLSNSHKINCSCPPKIYFCPPSHAILAPGPTANFRPKTRRISGKTFLSSLNFDNFQSSCPVTKFLSEALIGSDWILLILWFCFSKNDQKINRKHASMIIIVQKLELERPTLASRVPLFLLGHFLTNECEISDFCL